MNGTIKMALFGSAALLLAVAAVPAWAEMEVTESTVPGIATGNKIPDGARLSLPKGTMLRLLVFTQQGNLTKTLKGPFEGTVGEYEKKKPGWWNRLFGAKDDPEQPMAAMKSSQEPVTSKSK